jgi:hypothetical protein
MDPPDPKKNMIRQRELQRVYVEIQFRYNKYCIVHHFSYQMRTFLILLVLIAFARISPAQYIGYAASSAPSFTCRVYDSTDVPLPTNIPSVGYEANGLTEFGALVELRDNRSYPVKNITLEMSSWVPHSEWPRYPDCGFSLELTLKIYSANRVNESYYTTGSNIYTIPRDFIIPWKPEHNGTCPSGKWQDVNGVCRSGIAFDAIFDLSNQNITLPSQFIYGLEFNTQNYGITPFHEPGPYNSLNIGVCTSISVGDQVVDGTTFTDNGSGLQIDFSNSPYIPCMQAISENCN